MSARRRRQPLIVLMHGDRQVSTKNLARAVPCKSVEPAVLTRVLGATAVDCALSV